MVSKTHANLPHRTAKAYAEYFRLRGQEILSDDEGGNSSGDESGMLSDDSAHKKSGAPRKAWTRWRDEEYEHMAKHLVEQEAMEAVPTLSLWESFQKKYPQRTVSAYYQRHREQQSFLIRLAHKMSGSSREMEKRKAMDPDNHLPSSSGEPSRKRRHSFESSSLATPRATRFKLSIASSSKIQAPKSLFIAPGITPAKPASTRKSPTPEPSSSTSHVGDGFSIEEKSSLLRFVLYDRDLTDSQWAVFGEENPSRSLDDWMVFYAEHGFRDDNSQVRTIIRLISKISDDPTKGSEPPFTNSDVLEAARHLAQTGTGVPPVLRCMELTKNYPSRHTTASWVAFYGAHNESLKDIINWLKE